MPHTTTWRDVWLARWRAWRRRRTWTAQRQLEHLRILVQQDHRWLASDPVASALTERYLAALAPDWYQRTHEAASTFRERLGLAPYRGVRRSPARGPKP